jgi:hypothetical protein
LNEIKYTAEQLAECAEREVRQREWVYNRRVKGGYMTRSFADRQIGMMQQIARDYRRKAAEEAAEGDLLGRKI